MSGLGARTNAEDPLASEQAREHLVTTADEIRVREATEADLGAVVALLADDPLGSVRERIVEGGVAVEYVTAFREMTEQAGNMLLVATTAGHVVGCLQLVIIPGVSRAGAKRGQIEGVRVLRSMRGRSVGKVLVRDAVQRAREAGCSLVQLTTDTSRSDAARFYEGLGFEATHVGMKLKITI